VTTKTSLANLFKREWLKIISGNAGLGLAGFRTFGIT
jgi:hypothetical protein